MTADRRNLLSVSQSINHQQQQSFYSPLSGTTRVSQYQQKHSHTNHSDQNAIFISYFHLQWSIASSLFKLRAWQSFCTTSLHVLFGLPLGLEPSTSYSIHFFNHPISVFFSQHMPIQESKHWMQNNTAQLYLSSPLSSRQWSLLRCCQLDRRGYKSVSQTSGDTSNSVVAHCMYRLWIDLHRQLLQTLMLATSRDSAMSYSKLLDLVSGRLRPRCSTRVPHTAQSWLSSASPVNQRTVLTPSPVNQRTLFTQRHTGGPGECHTRHSRGSHQHHLSINVHYSHHHLSLNAHYSHSGTRRWSRWVPHTAQSSVSSASPVNQCTVFTPSPVTQRTLLTPSPVNQCTLFTQQHTEVVQVTEVSTTHSTGMTLISITCQSTYITHTAAKNSRQVVSLTRLNKPIISPISYVCLGLRSALQILQYGRVDIETTRFQNKWRHLKTVNEAGTTRAMWEMTRGQEKADKNLNIITRYTA